jgi:hypothetical protein
MAKKFTSGSCFPERNNYTKRKRYAEKEDHAL